MAKLVLPATIISPRDIAELEMELLSYGDWFRHNAIKQELHLPKGTMMPGLSQTAISLLQQVAENNRLSFQILDQLLQDVRSLRQTSPTMTVTLAAPPSRQLQQTIAKWCRKELHDATLIDFRFNATLLGGMVIRYGSHVYDWSFRRALLTNRYEFAEVLRRV